MNEAFKRIPSSSYSTRPSLSSFRFVALDDKKGRFRWPYLLLIVCLLFVMSGCSEDSPTGPSVILYRASFATGKVPWPHHAPGLTEAEYLNLIESLFIINNFGQYQSGDTRESAYFHDGLDVVLPNGTRIYAVSSGIVKAILDMGEYYQTIIIGDTPGTEPGNAWVYTHVSNFQVRVGDFVPQGTYIADIHFHGVPHVHLSRAYLSSGSWWNWQDLNFVQPDTFFVYQDSNAPVIAKPFYYFRGNSDTMFHAGDPTVVSGDVDIVVGIREIGEYAHSKDGSIVPLNFGDRLCVSRLNYEISGDSIETVHVRSWDFSKIVLNWRPDAYERVYAVYKFYYTIHPSGPTSWDRIFSYFVITNVDGTGEFGEVQVSDQEYAWNTAATDEHGQPKFPNGRYTITVTAWDAKGNEGRAFEEVIVENP